MSVHHVQGKERAISRKTIAQGRPGARHHLWSTRVRFSRADPGCQPAPGLPCALSSR
ncbi:protein of unknown function [Bradyrhizobium vignae]|uniref:Uncharacterized protein n=1 Tax=Bradyrhizobium vignae TaxID=1549949 RepID=A0A2U3Q5K5_9BRAD|nr:protein of unknown function [Bradyrhizobium vignae]